MATSARNLTASWKRFVRQYGVNLSYWYQPKGLAVTPQAVFERLSVLKEFERTRPWRECQSDFVTRLREEQISAAEDVWDEGGAPLARMLKQVVTVLGLAWIDPKDRVEITPAGQQFLDSRGDAAVLATQALRYQFWNPSVSSRTHQAIRLHPVPFLVRLMQSIGGYVTGAEYNLFVSKAQAIGDIDMVADEVDRFRALAPNEQLSIIDECRQYSIAGLRRSSIYQTITLNRSYAYRMWMLSGLVIQGPNQGLAIREGSIRGPVRAYLDDYASNGAYIEFVNEKEFLAWMGDPTQRASESAALDVYLNRGDLFAAASAKKRLGATARELREFKKMMIDEKTLEEHIEVNFADLGRRLNLTLDLVGRQYATTVGPIDLLGFDRKSGLYVVIELKRGRSADKVFGQLSRYMGWVRHNLAADKPVIGVIVAAAIDDKLRSARDAHDSDVRLVEFQSKMSLRAV